MKAENWGEIERHHFELMGGGAYYPTPGLCGLFENLE